MDICYKALRFNYSGTVLAGLTDPIVIKRDGVCLYMNYIWLLTITLTICIRFVIPSYQADFKAISSVT